MIVHVGIDVSLKRLDVAVLVAGRLPGKAFSVENSPEGLDRLIGDLRGLGGKIALVCMEATGRLEAPAAARLLGEGFPVAVVNPRQVRDFAKASGHLAKTDRLDARLIARFAATMPVRPRDRETYDPLNLKGWTARLRQLQTMIAEEKNRRHRAPFADIADAIDQVLEILQAQMKEVEAHIVAVLRAHPPLWARVQVLTTMPGIGVKSACLLVVDLPELGTLSGRQVAMLSGLAPVNRDSGTMRGKRTTFGGRTCVRRALYMVAVTAIMRNPVIRAMWLRLKATGKHSQTVLTACMRKIVVMANAMLRENQPWQPVKPDQTS